MAQSENVSVKLAAVLWRKTRRLFILIAGVTVILIGVVLLIAPGPAMLVIPLGLAILATEFVWAKRLLQRIKASATSAVSAVTGKTEGSSQQGDTPGSAPVLKPKLLARLRNAWLALIAPFRAGYVDPNATPGTAQLEAFPPKTDPNHNKHSD